MSVKLRLSRIGAKKNAIYRVVATNSRSPRDGRFIEQIGYYNPNVEPPEVKFDRDRIGHWLSVGAEPSDTVKTLIKNFDRAAAAAK